MVYVHVPVFYIQACLSKKTRLKHLLVIEDTVELQWLEH